MMTPVTIISSHVQRAPAGRMARMARHAWSTYWDWYARRATVRILRSLDGRTLRDIGLTRTEIESVVYGRPGERRLHYYHCRRSGGRS
jgi:uncharacterized protein YjiS (DUF1127 family)